MKSFNILLLAIFAISAVSANHFPKPNLLRYIKSNPLLKSKFLSHVPQFRKCIAAGGIKCNKDAAPNVLAMVVKRWTSKKLNARRTFGMKNYAKQQREREAKAQAEAKSLACKLKSQGVSQCVFFLKGKVPLAKGMI
jgi:hypothetical protein